MPGAILFHQKNLHIITEYINNFYHKIKILKRISTYLIKIYHRFYNHLLWIGKCWKVMRQILKFNAMTNKCPDGNFIFQKAIYNEVEIFPKGIPAAF